MELMYLYLEDEIVASESKSNDPKSIEKIKSPSDLGACSHWIVRYIGNPPLVHRYHPYHGAITEGSDGSNQRHPGYGVQVGQLRQQHRGTCKD